MIHGNTNRELKYALMLQRTGQILLFAGPLIVVGLMGLLAVAFPSLENSLAGSFLLVISPLLFLLSIFMGFKIKYRGKQYSARGKAAAFNVDTRQPVIYLRPFMADETVGGLFRIMLFKTGIWPWFFNVEEQLADAVEPLGPLVAIGKPGEQLPTPGALRQYFDDTTWQNVVQEWLLRARVIILRAGMSEGLWWELKEAVAAARAERLLLLVLNMKQADYLPFSQLVNDRLGIRLPKFNAVSRWHRASGFFEFNEAWQAHFLPLKAPCMRTEPYMRLRAAFNHTLQPTFTKLGVTWRPSPFSKFGLLVIGISVLGLIVFTAGYLMS